MELKQLREEVLTANLELVQRGLVIFTFGNASGFDAERQLVVIKPSGIPYEKLTPADLVLTDLNGKILEGSLRPSSDLPTHVALYQAFAGVRGVVHTHSRYATAWAQAHRGIPCLGTTHSDYVCGELPVTRPMRPEEIQSEYEWNTGQVIIERFQGLDPLTTPGVLVAGHAPFCWGPSVAEAAHTAIVIEELAHLAYLTATLNPAITPVHDALREKHFFRKHGPQAYYGQQNWDKTAHDET